MSSYTAAPTEDTVSHTPEVSFEEQVYLPPAGVSFDRQAKDKRSRIVYIVCLVGYLIYGIVFMALNANNSDHLEQTRIDCEQYHRRLLQDDTLNVAGPTTMFSLLFQHLHVLFFSVLLCGLGVAGWLYIIQKRAKIAIYATFLTHSAVFAAIAISFATYKPDPYDANPPDFTVCIVMFSFFSVLFGLLCFARKRIQHTSTTMKLAAGVLQRNLVLLRYSFLLGFVAFVFALFYILEMTVWEQSGEYKFVDDQCQHVQSVLPVLVFSLMTLWTLVLCSMIRTFVVAGTTAHWYFHGHSTAAANDLANKPVRTFFKWGITHSFGSNALAAAVIATLEFIAAMARSARHNRRGQLLYCLLLSVLSCIKEFVKVFTKFAVVMVAITGDSLYVAGKKSAKVLETSFVQGFVTDRFARMVLFFFGFIISVLIFAVNTQFGWHALTPEFQSANFLFGALVLIMLPQLGAIVLIFVPNIAASLCDDNASECVEAANSLGAGIFAACVTNIIIQFMATIIADSVDAIFVCYAIDRANGIVTLNKEEIHANIAAYGPKVVKIELSPEEAQRSNIDANPLLEVERT